MIKKKENIRISFLVIVVLLLSLLSIINTKNITIFFHNSYESLMTQNPGFSSSRNLIDEGGNQKELTISQRVEPLIRNFKPIFQNIFNKSEENLDNLEIFIKFKNYKKILDDREKSLEKGFLENPSEVNGEIKFGNEIYKAKFRLKGDLYDHWVAKTRVSLRIKLKDDKTIYGMNSFSIQKPRSRQHPYEQAFQDVLTQSSNLSLTTHYAKVILNGEEWGIMNIEEHFSKEFLEKKAKKESLIFRFSDDRKWKNYEKSTGDVFSPYLLSDSRLHGTFYNSKNYLKDEHYRKIYSYVFETRLLRDHSYLYTTNKHLELFYSSLIWNSFHTLANHNTKFYFNPYTLKLSPISSDQEIFSELNDSFIDFINDYQFNLNYRQIFQYSINKETSNKALLKSVSSFQDVEKYLNKYTDIFPLDLYKGSRILEENKKVVLNNEEKILNTLKDLNDSNESLKRNIDITNEQASNLLDLLHIRHFSNGRLEFFNLLPFEVEIKEILVDGEPIEINPFSITRFMPNAYTPHIVQTNLTGVYDDRIDVISAFKDNKRKTKAYPTMVKGSFNPIERPSSSAPFLTKKANEDYFIKKGSWLVNDPLVIEGNLTIEAGTELIFSKHSYLIVKGKINFNGRVDSKIQLVPKEDYWKGFYLISEKEMKSVIRNVEVRNTVATEDGILKLTGGFTIYNSDILINNLSFKDSIAEDSINIVDSTVNINNLSIEGSISDGLDCDFCEGVISNTYVNEIGGDAIDFSGSEVEIYNASISNVKDKAISVGEKSYIKVLKSDFKKVGVGVASKDSSETHIYDSTIKDFSLFAAMTYQKKMIFNSESNLYLNNTNIIGENPFRSQKGTNLYVDNIKIPESDLNVDEMYSQGVMKK